MHFKKELFNVTMFLILYLFCIAWLIKLKISLIYILLVSIVYVISLFFKIRKLKNINK